jgi:hypothetical protein
MECPRCNQEMPTTFTVMANLILEHPDVTLDFEYWQRYMHDKECSAV